MKTLAFLGCGHIHTPGFIKALQKRPGLKVSDVWDWQAERGRLRAAELGATFSDSPAKVLENANIGTVVICSETDRHPELVAAATRAGKDVFVEKPLGVGKQDADAMATQIETAGVKFQTGYFQRGQQSNLFIKEQIAAGAFGKITRVRGSNCHSGALGGWFDSKPADVANDWRWMADPKIAGVGAFGDLGTHSLDILLWLMGEVSAVTATTDLGTKRYDGCDETGEGLLRFKNGAIGTLAAAWDDVANPVSLLVSGTEGHAAVVNGQMFFQSKHVEGADGKTPWTKLPDAKSAGFEAFLDAIEGKPATLVGVREAAYRSTVMEALYAGARDQKWVTL